MRKKAAMIMLVLAALICLAGCYDYSNGRIRHRDREKVMIYSGIYPETSQGFFSWEAGGSMNFYCSPSVYDFGDLRPGDVVRMTIDYIDSGRSAVVQGTIIKVHSAQVVTHSYMTAPQEGIIRVNRDMIYPYSQYGWGMCYYLLYEESGDIVLIYPLPAESKYNIFINDVQEYTFRYEYRTEIDGDKYTYYTNEEGKLSEEELLARIQAKDGSIFLDKDTVDRAQDGVRVFAEWSKEKYSIVINGVQRYSFQYEYLTQIDGYMYTYFTDDDEELSEEELLSRIRSKDKSIFYMGKREILE